MIFCIAEAFSEEIEVKGPARVAFSIVEGAALYLILSPLFRLYEKVSGNDLDSTYSWDGFVQVLVWLILSVFASYRRRKNWSWPF